MIINISGKINSGKDTVAQIIHMLDWGFETDKIVKMISKGTKIADLNWKTKRWADPMKDTVCMWLGCTREQLEDREFKEAPLGEEWWKYKVKSQHEELYFSTYKEASEAIGGYYEPEIIKLTPRKLLQLLGTECGREILHPNIWINILMKDYEPKLTINNLGKIIREHFHNQPHEEPEYPNWIIPDSRFLNDVEAVKEVGGVNVRVERPLELRYKDEYFQFQLDGTMDRYDFIDFLKEEKNFSEHPSETALDHYDDWDYIINNDGTIEELVIKVKEMYEHIQSKTT